MSGFESTSESLPNPRFTNIYQCIPLINPAQRKVERGGKLLLPASALEEISFLEVPDPFMFKVTNSSNGHFTHAGVFEFVAEEGKVCAPPWMIKNLGLSPGDSLVVESVALPAATYCRIEPLTRNFAYISDVRTVLEENLRYFACLTEGDILFIHETGLNQIYKVKIVETRPESAVSILDCEVELELSVPEKPNRPLKNTSTEKNNNSNPCQFNPFQGQGQRLDGKEIKAVSDEETKKEKQNFVPFKGKGYKLKSGKHKHDGRDENEPQKKKRRLESKDNDGPNELVFIRIKQKEFVKKQSNEEIKPFQGQGNSLKDN